MKNEEPKTRPINIQATNARGDVWLSIVGRYEVKDEEGRDSVETDS